MTVDITFGLESVNRERAVTAGRRTADLSRPPRLRSQRQFVQFGPGLTP